MDELLNTKNQLISELGIQYKNLINFLQTLPVNQQFKSHGFMNLDQGMMWFQKAIELLQIDQVQENKVSDILPVEKSDKEINETIN